MVLCSCSPLPPAAQRGSSADGERFSDMTIYGHEFCLLPYRTGIVAVFRLGWLLRTALALSLVLPNVISDFLNAFIAHEKRMF